MAADDLDAMKRQLAELNVAIGEMEQTSGEEAAAYFNDCLSNQLVFRRASGAVVGKHVFIDSTKGASAFRWRRSEDISVTFVDYCALATLVVVGLLKKDDKVHRYRNLRLFRHTANRWLRERPSSGSSAR